MPGRPVPDLLWIAIDICNCINFCEVVVELLENVIICVCCGEAVELGDCILVRSIKCLDHEILIIWFYGYLIIIKVIHDCAESVQIVLVLPYFLDIQPHGLQLRLPLLRQTNVPCCISRIYGHVILVCKAGGSTDEDVLRLEAAQQLLARKRRFHGVCKNVHLIYMVERV
eukprot:XP_001709132.1 Hypothetical protein GL50803_91519 [Giardia lamblia ATCC 50803]